MASATVVAMRFSSPEPSFIESGGCSAAQTRKVPASGFAASAAFEVAFVSCAWAGAHRAAKAVRAAVRATTDAAVRRRPFTSDIGSFPLAYSYEILAPGFFG